MLCFGGEVDIFGSLSNSGRVVLRRRDDVAREMQVGCVRRVVCRTAVLVSRDSMLL